MHPQRIAPRIQQRAPAPAPVERFPNKFRVTARGEQAFILHPANGQPLERVDALNLAAWLIVVAEIDGEELGDAITEIRGEEPEPAADPSS